VDELEPPEPELGFIDAVIADKKARSRRTLDAVLERRPARAAPTSGTTSCDGGMRMPPWPVTTPEADHNELVAAVARLMRLGQGGDVFSP
jgi:hypothetical protein